MMDKPIIDEPIMTYSKIGGMRNLDDAYKIYPDGRVVSQTPMGGRLTGAVDRIPIQTVEELISLFEANGFSSMNDSYRRIPEPPLLMAQLMTQELTYLGKTVTVTDGGNPPQEFLNIVKRIEDIVQLKGVEAIVR